MALIGGLVSGLYRYSMALTSNQFSLDILEASSRSYMCGDPSKNQHVLLVGKKLWAKATQDRESAAIVDVLGDLPQPITERLRKRKRLGRNGRRG